MCVEVRVEPDGEVIQTMAELAAFLKERGVPPLHGQADDSCLCPVELEITAADAGYRQVQDWERNPFGVIWEKI